MSAHDAPKPLTTDSTAASLTTLVTEKLTFEERRWSVRFLEKQVRVGLKSEMKRPRKLQLTI